MGHGAGSKSFLNSYKAQTSTIDIQAMMHNVESTTRADVTKMSSMSLGRSEDAQLALSAEGEDRVMADPSVREASNRCGEALDRLTERYPSMEAAKDDDSVEYAKWYDSKNELKRLTRQARESERQKEYSAHLKAHGTLNPPVSSVDACASASGSDIQTKSAETNRVHCLSTTPSDPTASLETAMDLRLIDPNILSPEEFATLAGQNNDDSFEGMSLGTALNPDDDEAGWIGESGDNKDLDAGLKAECVHGAYRHHPKQRLAEGSSFESKICRVHRFDKLISETCDHSLSDTELAGYLMPFFKTMHALERYGELEPEPGSFVCPICLDDQVSKDDFDRHVVSCRHNTVVANADMDWRHDLEPKMAAPCGWKPQSGYHVNPKECQKTFTDLKRFVKHIYDHVYKSKVCGFPSCRLLSPRPRYEDLGVWSDHLAADHGLACVVPSSLVFFCAFCDTYVSFGISGPSMRVNHYLQHLPEAFRLIKELGYNEVNSTVDGISILSVRNPWFCIFCIHDTTLPADRRLAVSNEWSSTNSKTLRDNHLKAHFATIKDLVVPCPASAAAGADNPMCLSNEHYNSQELEQHLLKLHRIYRVQGYSTAALPVKRTRSRRKAGVQHATSPDVEGDLSERNDKHCEEDHDENSDEQNDTMGKHSRDSTRHKRQHLAETTGNSAG